MTNNKYPVQDTENMDLTWVYLIIAGLLEPCWVICLEKSDKLKNIPWTIATGVFLFFSMLLLSMAMSVLGPGTSYAVWTGIGAIGALIAGIILFREPVTYIRMFFIVLIVIGIVGINLTTGAV